MGSFPFFSNFFAFLGVHKGFIIFFAKFSLHFQLHPGSQVNGSVKMPYHNLRREGVSDNSSTTGFPRSLSSASRSLLPDQPAGSPGRAKDSYCGSSFFFLWCCSVCLLYPRSPVLGLVSCFSGESLPANPPRQKHMC